MKAFVELNSLFDPNSTIMTSAVIGKDDWEHPLLEYVPDIGFCATDALMRLEELDPDAVPMLEAVADRIEAFRPEAEKIRLSFDALRYEPSGTFIVFISTDYVLKNPTGRKHKRLRFFYQPPGGNPWLWSVTAEWCKRDRRFSLGPRTVEFEQQCPDAYARAEKITAWVVDNLEPYGSKKKTKGAWTERRSSMVYAAILSNQIMKTSSLNNLIKKELGCGVQKAQRIVAIMRKDLDVVRSKQDEGGYWLSACEDLIAEKNEKIISRKGENK